MRSTRKPGKISAGSLFVLPFVLCYVLFALFPMLYTMVISLTQWNGIGSMEWVGLENYRRLLTVDPYFWMTLGNTLIIAACTIPISMVMGFLLASALHGRRLKGKRFFQLVNFLPYITTPVAIGIIFSLLFSDSTGLVGMILQRLGIVDGPVVLLNNPRTAKMIVVLMGVWKNTGYQMLFFLAGLSTIPLELYDAVKVDGAGVRQTLFRITLPMLKDIMIFLVLVNIIQGFQLLDEPMLLYSSWVSGSQQIGGPGRSVYTTIWYLYETSFGARFELGKGSAIAYLLFMIIGGCVVVFRRMSIHREQDGLLKSRHTRPARQTGVDGESKI